ncbi:MAG: ligase-associated DNA damage response endonuclease PdeM [Saprospiraceae bacterium]
MIPDVSPSYVHQLEVSLGQESGLLLPDRAIWLPRYRTLLIADLHIGKSMHFRKAGIPIPGGVAEIDLIRLDSLIRQWQPAEVIFLGDLFHSQHNSEWDAFGLQISRIRRVRFSLVRGNHDILEQAHYDQYGIQVHPETFQMGGLVLSHDQLDQVPEGAYNLSGHVHPGFRLRGKGRQSATLPCFHLGPRSGILPAFGRFTGMKAMTAQPDDRVIVVVNDKLLVVPSGPHS